MLRAAFVVTAIALVAAPAAAADVFGAAQVRTADGALVAAARASSFAYPHDRSLVSVASVRATPARVELRGVSLLNGAVRADRVLLGRGGATIDSLVVNGLLRNARENALFSVDSASYVVIQQKAVIGKTSGFVALRLVVAPGYPGLPAGAQVLVGLRQRGQTRAETVRRVVSQPGPWAVLGFGGVPSVAGLPAVSDPLLGGVALTGSSLGGRAVAIAEQFLGVPYRWGGASPATGFDCSGFTQYVYARLGVSLTHYAATQLHEGLPVPPALLEPGDLVFFDPGLAGPDHVGIYIGGGAFIHAPHTGDVVKISTLAQYGDRYVGAVRPGRA
jgi:cell wall-associated NlpC family hydrolase